MGIIIETGRLIHGRPKYYSGTCDIAVYATLYVQLDLGRSCTDGLVINRDAANNLKIKISDDGVNYNGGISEGSMEKLVIQHGESFPLTGMKINKIKLNASANNTSYEVYAW